MCLLLRGPGGGQKQGDGSACGVVTTIARTYIYRSQGFDFAVRDQAFSIGDMVSGATGAAAAVQFAVLDNVPASLNATDVLVI